jgi:ubiquinone/menaquinone biosynthesis C-methylase UbiE
MKNLDHYMVRRYPTGGQSIIHWREMNILEGLLGSAGGRFEELLDCPCGYGRLTESLSRRSALLVSSDLSSRTVAAHNRYFKGSMERYLDTACDVTRLPYKDGAFEGMVTFRLFHHLVDEETRKAVFREAARVSRRFFLISYYSNSLLHEFSRKLNRNRSIRKGKKAFLDSARIQEEAGHAGWQLAEKHRALPVIHAQTVALFMKKE